MKSPAKSALIYGAVAFVVGFCLIAGGYIAHDLFRILDDDHVIWLVNRIGAAYAITLFVVLGFVTARAVEYAVVRWWRIRKQGGRPLDD